MTDITERLRRMATIQFAQYDHDAIKEAADEIERLQTRVAELEAQRVLEISGFLERLGVIAERLYNHDPRRGNLVAGDIKAIGAELIDIAQPLKAIAAAQPAQEQS